MCALYKDIQQTLAGRNLHLPTLNVLVPDVHPYEMLAIQTGGEVATGPDFVGHADRVGATAKFTAFLQLAVEADADLVLTPEYSCPWDALTAHVAHRPFPKQGKLWAIACESITPAQLQGIIVNHPQVEWVHDGIPAGAGRFLDVLVYMFRAEHTGGGWRNVVVLQFKTHPMGGTAFEQANLIRGSAIYFWHNPVDNIRLISLICSEALAFDQAAAQQCRFDLHAYIVLHPQLNPNPRHPDISAYRGYVFAHQAGANIDVFALNWARGFVLLGVASTSGGSALYTKAPQFIASDARLDANHRKGMFYSHWARHRTELCVLSFDEHVFHFRIHKPRQDALAVEASRTGPEMLALRHWVVADGVWTISPDVNDGYAQYCGTFQEPQCDYFVTAPTNAVDRERLLTLTSGQLRTARDWHMVRHIPAFVAEADERTKRLTFTHEAAAESQEFRRLHVSAFIKLQRTVLPNPANFPPTIHDLSANWRLHPPCAEHDFRFNLSPSDGPSQGATAIFVGLMPLNEVEKLKDDLTRAWGKIETRRLVLWYEAQNAIRHVHAPVPTITDDLEPPASIAAPDAS